MIARRRTFVLALSALALAACGHAPRASAPALAPTAGVVTPALSGLLAPGGTLRVALFTGSPTSLVSDAPGETRRGIAHDLGVLLAQRLGVRFEPVILKTPGDVLAALTAGRADVSFTSISPDRRKVIDFTPRVLGIEMGYLVPAGGALTRVDRADGAGLRIATFGGGTTHKELEAAFSLTRVIGAKNADEGLALLAANQADGFASHKGILYEMQKKLPGSQVLDGSFGTEVMALAVPKGRDAGMDYLSQFVAQVQSSGELGRIVERSGLRGVTR